MEIVHFILGKANPERMNGVNKVVNELANKQVSAGCKVSVWGIAADVAHNYPARNYQTRLFLKSQNPFHLSADLKKAIRNQKDTVFHLHGGFLPQMYSAAKLLHKLHIPFVFTPHGSYNAIAMEKNRFAKRVYRLLFERGLLKKASMIHVLGESETLGLHTWFPSAQTRIIPYGYDATDDLPAVTKSTALFIIGYCGRIDIFTKGLDALVKGFEQLHAQYPQSQLWILGDGKEMPELEKMITKTNIAAHIILYGAKYGEEKLNLISSCHVFAHPSRNEGLPSAILEATALGVPCLVTKATNTGDVIKKYNAGVVIGKTNSQSVYRGLCRLYKEVKLDNKEKELGNNARQMIQEAFNWDTILNSYLEMYKTAML